MAKQGASQVSFAYQPERIFWWIRWGEAEREGQGKGEENRKAGSIMTVLAGKLLVGYQAS